jgi:hypothetical protein
MPIVNSTDGCPINYQVEGPAERACADPVQFARHRSAHVGRPGAAVVAAFPADPLRPPRPRPSPARRKAPTRWTCWAATRSRSRTPPAPNVQLVRPVDGRHGRAVDGRQRARPRAQARALEHALLLRRQAALARPHEVRGGEGPRRALRDRRWSAGSPRASASVRPRRSTRWWRCSPPPSSTASSAAASRCATWISAPRLRPSTRPPWSSSAARIRRLLPAAGEAIHKMIKGSKLTSLEAAHLSNVEQAKPYGEAVLTFLTESRPSRQPGRFRHGRPGTAQARRGRAPPRARRCLGRQFVEEPQRVQRRMARHHHPQPVGRHLDAAAFRRAHAAHPGDRHTAGARPLGRVSPARARGGDGRRILRRRHQGDHPPAVELLRRAGSAITRSSLPRRCSGTPAS